MRNKSVFFYYIKNNKKNLVLLIIFFFVGLVIGITFINHIDEEQMQKISSYVISLKENIKLSDHINKKLILNKSIKQNITIVLVIWLLGCTLLGNFFIYIVILYKGFSIGYTSSAIIATLGIKSRYNICNFIFIITKHNFFTDVTYIIK